jgi:putative flippase GtrA
MIFNGINASSPSAPDFFWRRKKSAAEESRFKRYDLPAFAKFALLSGGGWLLDLATLLALTRIFNAPPFLANMASSVLAASFVFLISRKHIHYGVDKAVLLRLLAYVGYAILMILLASAAMAALIEFFSRWSAIADQRSLDVIIAKIVVTPPQLLLNFIVSRFVSASAPRRAE